MFEFQKAGTDYLKAMRAMYKAHLYSDYTAPPTSWNNQRKVVVDDNDYYHSVYESGGEIWYVKGNSGSSWSPEVLVSDRTGYAARPSIATSYESGYIVYVTYVDLQSKQVVVKMLTGWWDPLEVYRSDPMTSATTCYPVIACSMHQAEPTWMAVWNDGSDLKFTVRGVYHDYDANGEMLVQGQAGDPVFPTIAVLPQYGDPNPPLGNTFCVSWREGADVKYAELRTTETDVNHEINPLFWTQGQGVYGGGEVVHTRTGTPSGIALPAKGAPCITADRAGFYYNPSINFADYAFVAFEMDNTWTSWPASSARVSPMGVSSKSPAVVRSTSMPAGSFSSRFTVMEREYDYSVPWGRPIWANTNIGYTTYNYNNFLLKPSIMSKKGTIGGAGLGFKRYDVRVAYMHYQDYIYIRRYLSNPVAQVGDAVAPNTVPWIGYGNYPLEVYSEFASGGFNYKLASTSSGLNKTATIENIEMRELFVKKDSGVAIMGICNPRWSNPAGALGTIAWDAKTDSIGSDWYYPISLRMRTAAFDANNVDSLHFERELFAIHGGLFDGDSFLMNFHDAETGQIVLQRSIPMGELPEDSSLYELTAVNISSLGDRDVYLTFDVSGNIDTSDVQIIHFQGTMESDTAMGKSTQDPVVPSAVTLANFPNPFNPSTEITYGIPEETHVKLAVYDQLGREVKVLANGWKAAGTYTVTFDAAELPSGMYLYRIETGKGSVSKKMVLMK